MKTIYQGPRPAIAFGLMLAALSIFGLTVGAPGHLGDTLEGILILTTMFGAILALIYWVRIQVDDDGIAVRGFWSSGRILFKDISHSVPTTFAEKNHPLWLNIYGTDESPLLRLPLKSCRHRDVDWLLSLPQLKVRR